MDLSAVIFVALAVAWAVYLVPKALKHHDELARTRSVDRFSTTMRALAGRAVVTPGRPASSSDVTVKPRTVTTVVESVVEPLAELTPAQRRARRRAAQVAAQRRRRVLGTLLLALLLAVGSAALGLVGWWVTAAPGALIVMWLVVCRAMVRGERGRGAVIVPTEDAPAGPDYPSSYDVLRSEDGFDEVGPGAETASIDVADIDPRLWEPRPMMLPTYVGKDQAPMRQYVLTKDDSGVWSAGHDTGDSILARDVRDHDRDSDLEADRDADESGRAVGS